MMKWVEIVAFIMSESKKMKKGITSRNQLRMALGWTSPAGIYEILRQEKVQLRTFRNMMDVMGYDMLLIPRDPKRTAFKVEKDV